MFLVAAPSIHLISTNLLDFKTKTEPFRLTPMFEIELGRRRPNSQYLRVTSAFKIKF